MPPVSSSKCVLIISQIHPIGRQDIPLRGRMKFLTLLSLLLFAQTTYLSAQNNLFICSKPSVFCSKHLFICSKPSVFCSSAQKNLFIGKGKRKNHCCAKMSFSQEKRCQRGQDPVYPSQMGKKIDSDLGKNRI